MTKKQQRNGWSQMSRTRIWVLGLLLFFYLAGIFLLSAVSMHEPHNKTRSNGYNKQVRGFKTGIDRKYEMVVIIFSFKTTTFNSQEIEGWNIVRFMD